MHAASPRSIRFLLRSAVRSALRRPGSGAFVPRFQISRKWQKNGKWKRQKNRKRRFRISEARFRPSFLGASVQDTLQGLEPWGGRAFHATLLLEILSSSFFPPLPLLCCSWLFSGCIPSCSFMPVFPCFCFS